MTPKQSWVNKGDTRPTEESGLWIVSFDPDAVTICCSLVPANCPRIVLVIAEGDCIVKLYMNRFDVVAIAVEAGKVDARPGSPRHLDSLMLQSLTLVQLCLCRAVAVVVVDGWRAVEGDAKRESDQ